MRVLVTGGAGFIGSHTVVELLNNNHEVIVVDNLSNSKKEVIDNIEKITDKKVTFFELDINDTELENVFKENKIDAVIHFAGYKAVGESVAKPLMYYQNNIAASLHLYELMQKYNVKKIVFSSSATVYGDNYEAPFKEEYGYGTTTNPYGSSKLMNEIILSDLANADKDFAVVLLRYFNPIGAHKSGLIGENPNGIPNNLLPYIAKVAIGELEYLSVFGDDYDTKDGTGVRDYIHVMDLARAHVLALDYATKHTGAEVINVGSGCGYSVLEVLHAYERACGHEIAYKIKERRPGDIATSYADTKKGEQLLNFKTEYDIDDMCRDSYNFMLKQM